MNCNAFQNMMNKNNQDFLNQLLNTKYPFSDEQIRKLRLQGDIGNVTDGIFQTQEEVEKSALQPNAAPGDIKFRDINGDNVIL